MSYRDNPPVACPFNQCQSFINENGLVLLTVALPPASHTYLNYHNNWCVRLRIIKNGNCFKIGNSSLHALFYLGYRWSYPFTCYSCPFTITRDFKKTRPQNLQGLDHWNCARRLGTGYFTATILFCWRGSRGHEPNQRRFKRVRSCDDCHYWTTAVLKQQLVSNGKSRALMFVHSWKRAVRYRQHCLLH